MSRLTFLWIFKEASRFTLEQRGFRNFGIWLGLIAVHTWDV
jgi:hypothetical protein